MAETTEDPNKISQEKVIEENNNSSDFLAEILEDGLADLENKSNASSRESAEVVLSQVKQYKDLDLDSEELRKMEEKIRSDAADVLRAEIKSGLKKEKDLVNDSIDRGKLDKKLRKGKMAEIDRKYDKFYKEKLNNEVMSGKKDKIEEMSNEKLKKLAQEVLSNLVVHGKLEKDKKTGELTVKNQGDLDVKASLYLLKLAGVDTGKVEYVAPGDYKEGKVNIDTGEMDGVAAEYDNDTAFIDHHGPVSKNNTSATRYVYNLLNDLGMLEDEKYDYLEKMVDFVDKVDNFDYSDEYFKNYFKNSWQTLAGLSKMLSEDHLEKFFKYKDPKTGKYLSPEEPLKDSLLRKMGFIYKNKGEDKGMAISHKKMLEDSLLKLQEAEKKGFIINSGKKGFGKIFVNVDNKNLCSVEAAKAFGCDTYLSWSTNNNGFFISNLNREEISWDFRDGKKIRKTMVINPADGKRGVNLADVLGKMTKKGFVPSGELKDFLDPESKDKEFPLKSEKESESIEITEDDIELTNNPQVEKSKTLEDLASHEISGAHGIEINNPETELRKEALKGKLKLLKDRFKDFVIANREEVDFNRELLKRTHLIDDDLVKLRKVEDGSEGEIEILDDLEFQIENLLKDDWEEELIKYREASLNIDNKEGDIFSPEEMEDMDKLRDFLKSFVLENLDKDPIWEGMSKLGQDDFKKSLLLNVFKEEDIFSDKDQKQKESIIEIILNN